MTYNLIFNTKIVCFFFSCEGKFRFELLGEYCILSTINFTHIKIH
jgi:hypothetical protein